MEQVKEGFDSSEDNMVDVIIAQYSQKLGNSFDASINQDANEVIITKIPEDEKGELTYLLANQGYQVTYK